LIGVWELRFAGGGIWERMGWMHETTKFEPRSGRLSDGPVKNLPIRQGLFDASSSDGSGYKKLLPKICAFYERGRVMWWRGGMNPSLQ